MINEEQKQPREWITVDQGLALCIEANLPRTKKTIRSWCRNSHVTGQKQTTTNGERWVLDKSSLLLKIDAEKEIQAQFAPLPDGSNQEEPLPGKGNSQIPSYSNSAPVHSRSHLYEPVQTSSDQSEQVQTLQAEVQSLKIDKAVRDRHISILTRENEKGRDDLLSQSRYIGHLETKVIQSGDTPDQAFLSAPVTGATSDLHNPRQESFDVD